MWLILVLLPPLVCTCHAFHLPRLFPTVVVTTSRINRLVPRLQRAVTTCHYGEVHSDNDESTVVNVVNHNIIDNSKEFHEYLNRKELRQNIKSCEFFQGLSSVEIELVVQTCTEVILQPNEVLFRKGDIGDGIFIVKSGGVEIILPDENENNPVVLATFEEEGNLFGELSLLLNEPRAATCRATQQQEQTALWKLSKADFQQIYQGNVIVQQQALQTITQDPKYAQYLETRELQTTMLSCPIFRGLQLKDLERTTQSMELVTYTNGEAILTQGEQGDAMYFIKSGSVICRDDVTNSIVTEIGVGGYFGELALLFNKPRAVTVEAKGAGVVLWKLTANNFFDAVQDASLSQKTLELLQDKYKVNSLWKTMQKASLEEIADLIRNASRPKKKNVTPHSVISTIYAGIFLAAYIPQFHPTLHNDVGSFQLFSQLNLSEATVLQYRLCSFLAVVISLMGQFRIAKNAPTCRKNYFTTMLWASLGMWCYGDSNVSGAIDQYTFDIFSSFGAGFIILSNAIAALWVLRCVDDAIAGPMKGREQLPLVSSRLTGVILPLLLYLGICIQMEPLIWSIYDSKGFQEFALPFYQLGYERLTLVAGFTFNGVMTFGALIGTLLFEQKISKATAALLNFVLLFATVGDQVGSVFMDKTSPQHAALIPLTEWMGHYRDQFHVTWIVSAVVLAVISNSLRKRVAQE